MKKSICLWCFLLVVMPYIVQATDLPKPPAEHPRVFFTKAYLPILKENLKSEVMRSSYEYIKKLSQAKLPPQPGVMSAAVARQLEARAFMYAIGEASVEHAKETIAYTIEYLSNPKTLQTSTIEIYKDFGMNGITPGAFVYDWCYDCMTPSDKSRLGAAIVRMMLDERQIVRPDNTDDVKSWNELCGYAAGEPLKYMSVAMIALYDEYPQLYHAMAEKILGSMADARKMLFKAGNVIRGISYETDSYSAYVMRLFERMGVPDIFGRDYTKTGYKFLYSRLPDGRLIKDGDDFTGKNYIPFQYQSTMVGYNALAVFGTMGNDGYLYSEWLRYNSKNSIDILLLVDPSVKPKLPDTLPLAIYSEPPMSEITARTSWQYGIDSPAAVAFMNMHNRKCGDHTHADVGSFQIYYKGPLAISGGMYEGENSSYGTEHYRNYYIRTVAHNCMTIYDPNETFLWGSRTDLANDGGQKLTSFNGSVLTYTMDEFMSDDALRSVTEGVYIGPDKKTPAYSYIKGDLTSAYSEKVKKHQRAMVFMDLFREDYPAAFVVFDYIKTSNKSFKKSWLLHSVEEPKVNGAFTTIARTENGYNGKLVNKTMYPENIVIEKIGGEGREFETNGVNYPTKPLTPGADPVLGNWRVEISPEDESEEDIFLNAMYVTDYDKNLPELPMYREDTPTHTGVTVSDRMVMFSRNGRQINNDFELTVRENGYPEMLCLVTDLSPGMWRIENGGNTMYQKVKETENVLVFTAKPGRCVISRADEVTEETPFVYAEAEKEKIGDFLIRVGNIFSYVKKPTMLIEDIPYVSSTDLTLFGCEILERGTDSVTAVKDSMTAVFTVGLDFYQLGETTVALNGEIIKVGNEIYVPICGIGDFLGYEFSYHPSSLILDAIEKGYKVKIKRIQKRNFDNTLYIEAELAKGFNKAAVYARDILLCEITEQVESNHYVITADLSKIPLCGEYMIKLIAEYANVTHWDSSLFSYKHYDTEQNIFHERFENSGSGSFQYNLQGVSALSTGESVDGTKAFKIIFQQPTEAGKGPFILRKGLNLSEDIYEVQFDVFFSSALQGLDLQFRNLDDSRPEPIAAVMLFDKGILGNGADTYSPGKWYRARIVLDGIDGGMDFFVDGRLVCSYDEYLTVGINQIRFTFHSLKGENDFILLDNIVLNVRSRTANRICCGAFETDYHYVPSKDLFDLSDTVEKCYTKSIPDVGSKLYFRARFLDKTSSNCIGHSLTLFLTLKSFEDGACRLETIVSDIEEYTGSCQMKELVAETVIEQDGLFADLLVFENFPVDLNPAVMRKKLFVSAGE